MRLTTFTDYGLRVLIYTASAPEGRTTVPQVAAAFGISEHHLVKVAHQLGKLGVLKNTRGRGGGIRLARAASEINVGEVMRAIEGEDVPVECFDARRNKCRIAGHCELECALVEAVQAFHAVLARYTLEDLVRNRRALRVVLHGALAARAP